MTIAGSVRRLPTGGWIADVSLNGRRKTSVCKTKAQAEARRRELACELAAAPAVPASAPVPSSFSLAQARELSIKERWAGRPYLRTAMIYSQDAVRWFRNCDVSAITASMVDQWRDELRARGNRPATINRKVSALRAMLQDAQLRGHLAAVPPMPRQLPTAQADDRVISREEERTLSEAFIRMGEPAAADLLVFLLNSAARFGEAERLRGRDVSLERRQVTFWQTKNGNPRTVPLTKAAIDALSPHLPAVSAHRVWPYTYAHFHALFQRAKAVAGLDGDRRLTIHTCRHTCATRLAEKGVSQFVLMRFGGWRSLTAVQRYVHLNSGALAECVEALESGP